MKLACLPILSVALTALIGCSVAQPSAETSVSALTSRPSLSKKLEPPIPVPQTYVGTSFKARWLALIANRTQLGGVETQGDGSNGSRECQTVTYANEVGTADLKVARCGYVRRTLEGSWVTTPTEQYIELKEPTGTVLWIDTSYDLKIDIYRDSRLRGEEQSGMFRITHMIEDVDRIPDFELVGYDPACVPPTSLAERIREDTDGDGMFDTETVTAREGAWVCP